MIESYQINWINRIDPINRIDRIELIGLFELIALFELIRLIKSVGSIGAFLVVNFEQIKRIMAYFQN